MFELVFYYGGTAILTKDGEVVWASDADEKFMEEFDDTVTIDDSDEVLDYLEDEQYLPEGVECALVSDASGDAGESDDEEEDEDEDEDDELVE